MNLHTYTHAYVHTCVVGFQGVMNLHTYIHAYVHKCVLGHQQIKKDIDIVYTIVYVSVHASLGPY